MTESIATVGDARPRPHIGAFVLETLTLGMYGEPKHTLREYVQNSFDAIRAARKFGHLEGNGRVTVRLLPDRIIIVDNGLGVRADQAWETLTSIGASKKARQHEAGFRGIGRLAGMAYCDALIFRTRFPGEPVVTTIRFNAREILQAMSPDASRNIDLGRLLSEQVSMTTADAAHGTAEHFFEVTMQGLDSAPLALIDPDEVRTYLQENVPLPFEPTWERADEIERAYSAFFRGPIESVELFLEAEETEEQLYKPYSDSVKIARAPAQIATIDVEAIQDQSLGYWGWYGTLNRPGAVADAAVQGLRIRVRNIQVGGAELVSAMFGEVGPSYARLNAWYVGEIHIDPTKVIPNARRDGFEEDEAWLTIRESLVHGVLGELARDAHARSKRKQTELEKIENDVGKLVVSHRALMASPRATYDQLVQVMATAKTTRRNTVRALNQASEAFSSAVNDEEAAAAEQVANALRERLDEVEGVETNARLLVGRFTDDEDRLASLRARLREEVVGEVMAILKHLVSIEVVEQVRHELERTAAAI